MSANNQLNKPTPYMAIVVQPRPYYSFHNIYKPHLTLRDMEKIFEFNKNLSKENLFNSLPKEDRETINRFKDYVLITAGEKRTDEGIREIVRFRFVIGKPFNEIDLEDLRYFLKELKGSDFGDLTKNKIKDWVKRFLRWNFKDWSERFNEFYDIKTNSDAQRKKQITDKEILREKEVNQLMEAEPTLFWKTFLITQFEGALRTGEARKLRWAEIDFGDDGFTTLNIPSKKNKHGTTIINPVVVKIAGNFLRELKRQQDKFEIKTPYVFPSPQNLNKPISKAVNQWFKGLCKRVLGRDAHNYLLRHGKATELQEKVRTGTLTKDNAVEFMRHSEKMFDKTYSHMDRNDIKQLMKKQIYDKIPLTPEENDRIKTLNNEVETLKRQMEEILHRLEKKFKINESP